MCDKIITYVSRTKSSLCYLIHSLGILSVVGYIFRERGNHDMHSSVTGSSKTVDLKEKLCKSKNAYIHL